MALKATGRRLERILAAIPVQPPLCADCQAWLAMTPEEQSAHVMKRIEELQAKWREQDHRGSRWWLNPPIEET